MDTVTLHQLQLEPTWWPHLHRFIEREPFVSSFRYFNTRSTVYCRRNHLVTLIAWDPTCQAIVGYAHLDGDNTMVWVGLYVVASHRRRGLGARMLRQLLQAARRHGLNAVYLTVDKHNTAAQALYQKFGFSIVSSYVATGHEIKMRRVLSS